MYRYWDFQLSGCVAQTEIAVVTTVEQHDSNEKSKLQSNVVESSAFNQH